MLIGYAMKIGTFLENNNLGIFIYILFQTGIFYLGLIQNVFLMKKWDVKDRFIKLMLVLYIILPVYFILFLPIFIYYFVYIFNASLKNSAIPS